jgi:D-arabinose 1-dehydrogenase-like Zn-dependent alcohol dehydrogenase
MSNTSKEKWSSSRARAVHAWYSGTARDSQDTLEVSVLSGVHPMIEKYPLSRVAEAYEQMHSGKVRFPVVLSMEA